MKKFSITLKDRELEKLDGLGSKRVPTTQIAIEGFLYLREQVINSLEGKLNAMELKLIVDCLNGIDFKPEYASDKRAFLTLFSRFCKLSKPLADIDLNYLYCMIDDRFTSVDLFYLQYEVWRFWNIPEAYSHDFEKFSFFFRNSLKEENGTN